MIEEILSSIQGIHCRPIYGAENKKAIRALTKNGELRKNISPRFKSWANIFACILGKMKGLR
jgi:hypothetical protein